MPISLCLSMELRLPLGRWKEQSHVSRILCVSPCLRKLTYETRIFLLNTAIASADAVQHNSEFDPSLKAIGMEAGSVTADLEACSEKVLLCRKTSKNMRERWFGADSVASSVIREAASRTVVRFSADMEAGDVQYVDEHHEVDLSCCSLSMPSPVNGKKRQVLASPIVASKNFSIVSPFAARRLFEAVLEERFEKCGASRGRRDWCIAPDFMCWLPLSL